MMKAGYGGHIDNWLHGLRSDLRSCVLLAMIALSERVIIVGRGIVWYAFLEMLPIMHFCNLFLLSQACPFVFFQGIA